MSMKKQVLIWCAVACCVIPNLLLAQTAPVIQWDRSIGSGGIDHLFSIQQTTDGGYFLTGTSDGGIDGDRSQNSRGLFDYWVVKLDASGKKVWDKSLGGTGSEVTSSVRQTSDGNYLIGGTSIGINGDKTPPAARGGLDYWIIKLNANGNKVWDKTVGAQALDRLNSFQQTSDGGFILGGSSPGNIGADKTQNTHGAEDFWIVKLGPQVVGLAEDFESAISVYPNPASGVINLQIEAEKPGKITVYNALGQRILTQPVKAGNNPLDLSKATKGVYTIRLITGEKVRIEKVVLQ